MKENSKKALYESIMQKVSQQVVEMLNENNQLNEAYKSSAVKKFTEITDLAVEKYPDMMMCYAEYYPRMNEFHMVSPSFGKKNMRDVLRAATEKEWNTRWKGLFSSQNDLVLSELTDDDLMDGGKIYKKNQFIKEYKDKDIHSIPCLVIGYSSRKYSYELIIASYVLPLKESAILKAREMSNKKRERFGNNNPRKENEYTVEYKKELEDIKSRKARLLSQHIFAEDEELQKEIVSEINTFCRNIVKILNSKKLYKDSYQRFAIFRYIYDAIEHYVHGVFVREPFR